MPPQFDMGDLVEQLSARMNGRIDETISLSVKKEMAAGMKEMMGVLEALAATLVEKVIGDKLAEATRQLEARMEARVQSAMEALTNKVAALEAAQDGQNRAARLNNLVIKNLEDGGRAEDVKAKVLALLPGLEPGALVEVRRLGAPRDAPGARARPVLARFATSAGKHAALQHSKRLRPQKVYLDQDLTPAQQRARLAKRDRFAELRQHGMRPFWRDEQLCYVNNGRMVADTGAGPPPSAARDRTPPPPPRSPPSRPAGGAPSGGPSSSTAAGEPSTLPAAAAPARA
jgi:hypothetical protein